MSFKLRMVKPAESQVLKSIEDALVWQIALGRVHSFKRTNGGAAASEEKGKRRWIWFYRLFYGGKTTNKGYPDISGILADGRAFLIEVKKPGGKLSAEQQDFLYHHTGVCPCGVATNVDEALKIIGVKL